MTPDFYKHHHHKSRLRKQKTTDQLSPEDRHVSSCITEQKLPKRKAKSLEIVTVGQSFKFHENVTKEEISDSEVKSPNPDKGSLDVDRSDCGKYDNVSRGFPSNGEHWLQSDLLFASHKKTSTDITPKSAGFEPSLEDWENLEAALPKSERSEPARVSEAVDELVDSLLSEVVTTVTEGGVATTVTEGGVAKDQRDYINNIDYPDMHHSHNGFDNEEYPRDFTGLVDYVFIFVVIS